MVLFGHQIRILGISSIRINPKEHCPGYAGPGARHRFLGAPGALRAPLTARNAHRWCAPDGLKPAWTTRHRWRYDSPAAMLPGFFVAQIRGAELGKASTSRGGQRGALRPQSQRRWQCSSLHTLSPVETLSHTSNRSRRAALSAGDRSFF